jgi:cyclic pyranopterin phosphate synthase
MTTNGSRLADLARPLREAGLDRVTVSLDSLDEDVFRAMNDAEFPVSRVVEGIEAALAAGFRPVKINMVVKRGENDHTVTQFARRFRGPGYIVRFIEYMDVGNSNGWRMDDVLPAAEVVRAIGAEMPLEPAEATYRGEVARRYRYKDGSGEIGAIASVTQPFCGDCTRARLSADGKLYTCLFGVRAHDFRKLLREEKTDEEITAFLARVWGRRKDRYSELRTAATPGRRKRVEMSYIGG